MITISTLPQYPWRKPNSKDGSGRVFLKDRWVHICKKCSEEFVSKKLLKKHRQEVHSY